MIRFPAEAAGLRFERDPDPNRSLDEALLEAAIASPEPLPLLEHLLSRLYQRQLDRKDGLLRWSNYRGLGELQDALAQHVKTVFLTLKRDEQQALKFVIRQAQKRADLAANQFKSGQTQPLNPGQNSESVTSP